MRLEPINDFLLIKVNKESEKSQRGMIIAHEEGDKTEAVAIRGIIVSISKAIKKTAVKTGDEVFVAKWEGQHVNFQAEHFLLIKEKDVLAIVRK